MSNQLYGGGSMYPSARSIAEHYLDDSSSASLYHSSSSSSSRYHHHPLFSSSSNPTAGWSAAAAGSDHHHHHHLVSSTLKRPLPSQALYHQSILDAHNTTGQTEAWFQTDSLVKRPRYESSTGGLPVYPQRPGEKDCAHYMLTRTCKFGESCIYDHPIWVPQGGIPDWKEVPVAPTSEALPERPGEQDCPYFLKTQTCKFGLKCKFNHPKDKTALSGLENVEVSTLPERPAEPPCAFYMKTGKCKFGPTCKFHHPRDVTVPLDGQDNGGDALSAAVKSGTTGETNLPKPVFTPALLHNSKGLPVRPGEVDCPFYLKTGSCKYGATCRYNHPDMLAIGPSGAVGPAVFASPAAQLNSGGVNPTATVMQTINPRLTQATLGLGAVIYPQRPGQMECDFYMKTGECKFGERCKFHHPIDRTAHALSVKEANQQGVKLTLAGLPRREGAINCPYYMKTGACKYGATCRFDHPPPGEVMAAAAASQGSVDTIDGEGKGGKKDAETPQE